MPACLGPRVSGSPRWPSLFCELRHVASFFISVTIETISRRPGSRALKNKLPSPPSAVMFREDGEARKGQDASGTSPELAAATTSRRIKRRGGPSLETRGHPGKKAQGRFGRAA